MAFLLAIFFGILTARDVKFGSLAKFGSLGSGGYTILCVYIDSLYSLSFYRITWCPRQVFMVIPHPMSGRTDMQYESNMMCISAVCFDIPTA